MLKFLKSQVEFKERVARFPLSKRVILKRKHLPSQLQRRQKDVRSLKQVKSANMLEVNQAPKKVGFMKRLSRRISNAMSISSQPRSVGSRRGIILAARPTEKGNFFSKIKNMIKDEDVKHG
jgi:hypothetical protein